MRRRRLRRRFKVAIGLALLVGAVVAVPRAVALLSPETRCVILVDRSSSVGSAGSDEEHIASLRRVIDGCRRAEARTRIHFFSQNPLSAETVTVTLKFEDSILANPTTRRSGRRDIERVVAIAREQLRGSSQDATDIVGAFRLAERDLEGARGKRLVVVLTDGVHTAEPNLTGLREDGGDVTAAVDTALRPTEIHLGQAAVYFVGVGLNDEEQLSPAKHAVIEKFWREFIERSEGKKPIVYVGRLVTFP